VRADTKLEVSVTEHPGPWNYFMDAPVLTTATYPDDLDTTSYALTTLDLGKENADTVMNETLKHINTQDIIQVHFDHDRNYIDPVVCINVLRLFQRYGRRYELENTLSYVLSVLKSNEYTAGTRYYPSPDSFLYFLSCLSLESKQHCPEGDPKLENDLAGPLRKAFEARVGNSGDSVELAEREIDCHNVGIQDFDDLEMLMSIQEEDGGWKPGYMYGYVSTGEKIVNKGLTTALAVKAIEGAGLLYEL
jgi:hypothetical protein